MKNEIDELAAQAMEGMLAAGTGILTSTEVAENAYAYAEALLEERKRRNTWPKGAAEGDLDTPLRPA